MYTKLCIDRELDDEGVRVYNGAEKLKPNTTNFKWDDNKRWEDDLCVEDLEFSFQPKHYEQDTYTITLQYTLRATHEKFLSAIEIDVDEGDVLDDIGFSETLVTYKDQDATQKATKFELGQKFFVKISLDHLVVDVESIKCTQFKVIQEKDGKDVPTDMIKEKEKYKFYESGTTDNAVICGGELESPHFHISVEGWSTTVLMEITLSYKQGDQENLYRRVLRLPIEEDVGDEYILFEESLEDSLGSGIDYSTLARPPQVEEMSVQIEIEAASETELEVGVEEIMAGFEDHFYSIISKATMIAILGVGFLFLTAFRYNYMKGKKGEKKPLLEYDDY